MAKAREIEGFAEAGSFAEAARLAVETRTEELFSFAEGVLDTSDIERVHDMRVATRRLRAALEVFAVCFPKREFERALEEVKELADALGVRRDPDVALATVERIGESLATADRRGIASFAQELREDQAAGNREVAAALARVMESDLEARLLTLAAKARGKS